MFLVEAVLGAAHLFVSYVYTDKSLMRIFHMDYERNVPTWFSSSQLLMVGAVWAILGVHLARRQQAIWPVVAASAAFIFLSMDEAAQVHERISTLCDALLPNGSRDGTDFSRTGVWMLILPPIGLVGFLLWLRAARPVFLGHRGRGKMLLGVLIFFTAVTIPEYVFNFYHETHWASLLVFFEELGEMVGVTFLLWGVWELCASHEVEVRIQTSVRAAATCCATL